jgi:hypothetical protein
MLHHSPLRAGTCGPPRRGRLIVVPPEQPRHRQKLANDDEAGDGGEQPPEAAVLFPAVVNPAGTLSRRHFDGPLVVEEEDDYGGKHLGVVAISKGRAEADDVRQDRQHDQNGGDDETAAADAAGHGASEKRPAVP